MKTAELRVNNIVSVNKGFEMKVFAVFDDDTIYLDFEGNEGDWWEEDIKNISGVPLTEEWLLKLGGVDNDYTIDFKCKRKKISFRWGTKVVSTGYRSGFKSTKYPHIKHVHQLQNLFQSLTGEELKV